MLHSELGRHPIQINFKPQMIVFWLSIVIGEESKLSKLLYTVMIKEKKGFNDYKSIRCINDILVSVGQQNLLRTDLVNKPKSIKMDISRTLSDPYILGQKRNAAY